MQIQILAWVTIRTHADLDDNTTVYDVILSDDDRTQQLSVPCNSEKDAKAFAAGLADLIADHTTELLNL